MELKGLKASHLQNISRKHFDESICCLFNHHEISSLRLSFFSLCVMMTSFSFVLVRFFFSISRLPWLNWTARTIIDDFNFFSSSLPLLFVLLHVAAACVCVWLMRELNFSFLKISTFSCTRIVVDDERQKEENFIASTWTKKSNYFSYFLLVLSQANNMKSHWNIIAGNSPVDEREWVLKRQRNYSSALGMSENLTLSRALALTLPSHCLTVKVVIKDIHSVHV